MKVVLVLLVLSLPVYFILERMAWRQQRYYLSGMCCGVFAVNAFAAAALLAILLLA